MYVTQWKTRPLLAMFANIILLNKYLNRKIVQPFLNALHPNIIIKCFKLFINLSIRSLFFRNIFEIKFRTAVKETVQLGGRLYLAEWIIWPPAQFFNFAFLPTRYAFLSTRYKFLPIRYTFLSTRYKFLPIRYTFLFTRYKFLPTRYTLLSFRYTFLSTRYTFLSTRYTLTFLAGIR